MGGGGGDLPSSNRGGEISAPQKFGVLCTVVYGNFGTPKFWGPVHAKYAIQQFSKGSGPGGAKKLVGEIGTNLKAEISPALHGVRPF